MRSPSGYMPEVKCATCFHPSTSQCHELLHILLIFTMFIAPLLHNYNLALCWKFWMKKDKPEWPGANLEVGCLIACYDAGGALMEHHLQLGTLMGCLMVLIYRCITNAGHLYCNRHRDQDKLAHISRWRTYTGDADHRFYCTTSPTYDIRYSSFFIAYIISSQMLIINGHFQISQTYLVFKCNILAYTQS